MKPLKKLWNSPMLLTWAVGFFFIAMLICALLAANTKVQELIDPTKVYSYEGGDSRSLPEKKAGAVSFETVFVTPSIPTVMEITEPNLRSSPIPATPTPTTSVYAKRLADTLPKGVGTTLAPTLPVIQDTGDMARKSYGVGAIEAEIVRVFGEAGNEAIAVAKCESGLRLNAVNHNKNGTYDASIFQVNSVHGISKRFVFDLKVNVAVAKKLYDDAGGTWKDWRSSYKCHKLK